MAYFGSGVRPSMFDLALLHAAARCERAFLRGQTIRQLARRPGDDAEAFHARLVRGAPDEPRAQPPRTDGPPLLAVLHRGGLDLPKGSLPYALFRARVIPSLAATICRPEPSARGNLSVVVHVDCMKAPLVVQRPGDVKRLVEQTLDPMASTGPVGRPAAPACASQR